MNYSKICSKLNKQLQKHKLTKLTWGNVSIKYGNLVFIKPSGVDFKKLTHKKISIIDLQNNKILGPKPSVDTPIHLEIYKNFPDISCIAHTHSKFATIWSQARKEIPIIGTTHADCFPENIPLIDLDKNFNFINYEINLGKNIVNYFKVNNKDPNKIKAILIANHGPFIFCNNYKQLIEYCITLEYIAEMATYSNLLGINHTDNSVLFSTHFERKHGENKYYGQ